MATPFAVGPVNTYLIEGDPLTLFDTGPNLASAMVELEGHLAAIGYAFEDLDLLVITHQHVDHLGLTGLVAERSGADVACLDLAVSFVEDLPRRAAQADEFQAELMLAHGVDQHVVEALQSMAGIIRSFANAVPVTRPLHDGGDLVAGGRELRVLHRPGHSPSDTVFLDGERRYLLAGDHLLRNISSNALTTRPLDPDWDGTRPRPLVDYRRSLLATRELDVDVVLGGHGPPIVDHRTLIDERLRDHARRAERLLELLRDGPMSAHALATAMWGRVAFTQAFLTLSEVLGHLDLLLDDGVVAEDASGDPIRFEAI